MFVRVRGAGENDPLHEFDVPVRDYENRSHLFILVDAPLTRVARPAKFVTRKPKPAKRKKPGPVPEDVGGDE